MNSMARDISGHNRTMADTVTLLTINLAMAAVPLPFGFEFPISPHIGRRLDAAPALLQASGADIILLQEVFTARCRDVLLEAMRDSHPHAFWRDGANSLMGNGLLILSRWPIDGGQFIPFADKHPLAQSVWQRGVLTAELQVPGIGALRVTNVHLSPDPPFIAPDRAPTRAYRAREIECLLAAAAGASGDTILAGDFNTSPEICPDDYRSIVERGYRDVIADIHGTQGMSTFERGNPLVRVGRYRNWPDQRADHILLKAGTRLKPLNARIVFREPLSHPQGPAGFPLSDHYGVQVTLAR